MQVFIIHFIVIFEQLKILIQRILHTFHHGYVTFPSKKNKTKKKRKKIIKPIQHNNAMDI